jgi:hypothetical protein
MFIIYAILWLLLAAVLSTFITYAAQFLGLVKDKTDLIGNPVVMGISVVISAVILVVVASTRITDPFRDKLSWIKRKRKFINVKHNIYLEESKKQRTTYIGYDRMNRVPVSIDDEIRTRHIHVLGSTGSGKSVLLFNIFKQDVETGGAVILIDAKGDMENQEIGRAHV